MRSSICLTRESLQIPSQMVEWVKIVNLLRIWKKTLNWAGGSAKKANNLKGKTTYKNNIWRRPTYFFKWEITQ